MLELNETVNKRKPLKLSMYEAVKETRDGDTLFVKGMPISGVLNTQKDAPLMESCATLCGLLNFMFHHYSVTLASHSQVLFPSLFLFFVSFPVGDFLHDTVVFPVVLLNSVIGQLAKRTYVICGIVNYQICYPFSIFNSVL